MSKLMIKSRGGCHPRWESTKTGLIGELFYVAGWLCPATRDAGSSTGVLPARSNKPKTCTSRVSPREYVILLTPFCGAQRSQRAMNVTSNETFAALVYLPPVFPVLRLTHA